MKRLLIIVGVVLGTLACARRESPRASATTTSTPMAGPASTTLAPTSDPFDRCVRELMGAQEGSVRANIQWRFHLSPDDAHDLVRDALVSTCVSHSSTPYAALGAAFQRAADNRARDNWRRERRYLKCPLDDRMPTCAPGADETTRFDCEDRVVEAALCKEDRVSERIVRQRVMEDMDFAAIGAEYGQTADWARTAFHNALRRVQKRVAQACGR